MEGEIAETRQENAQTIVTLEAKLEDQERGAGARTDELEESVETLTGEATVLRSQVKMMVTELEAREQEVVQATSRAETAEEHVKHLEEGLERLRHDLEMERLQAVAEETHKWEAREARLIRRLDELEGACTRPPREAPMDLHRDSGDDPTDKEGSLDAGETGAGVITTTVMGVITTTVMDADTYVVTGTSIAGDKSSVTTTPVRADKGVDGPGKG